MLTIFRECSTILIPLNLKYLKRNSCQNKCFLKTMEQVQIILVSTEVDEMSYITAFFDGVIDMLIFNFMNICI